MTDEQLEFSISQYLDGTLDEPERTSLERRLSEDADARAILDGYLKLDGLVKSDVGLPTIQWDSFAHSISLALDAAEAGQEEGIARRFRIPEWMRAVAVPMAMAASLIVATGLGIYAMRMGSRNSNGNVATTGIYPSHQPISFASVSVFGSQNESNQGPGEVQVAIGPSDDAKDQPILVHYSGDMGSRSSRVAVASGVAPVHDTDAMQFDMQ